MVFRVCLVTHIKVRYGDLFYTTRDSSECFRIECFESLQKCPVNTDVTQGIIPRLTLFLLYICDVCDDIIRNLVIWYRFMKIWVLLLVKEMLLGSFWAFEF